MFSYFPYNALFVIIMNCNDLKQPCLFLVHDVAYIFMFYVFSFNTNCSTDWIQQVKTLNQNKTNIKKYEKLFIAWKII